MAINSSLGSRTACDHRLLAFWVCTVDARRTFRDVRPMDPAEADDRILESRTMLKQFREMIDRHQWPVDNLPIFQQEIDLLEAIAEEHPGKINQLIGLVAQWSSLQNSLRAKLD